MLTDKFTNIEEYHKKEMEAYQEELTLYTLITKTWPFGVDAYLWTCKHVNNPPIAEVSFPKAATEDDVKEACRWLSKLAGRKLDETAEARRVQWKAIVPFECRGKECCGDVRIVYDVKGEDACIIIPKTEIREFITYQRLCPGDAGYAEALEARDKEAI